MIAPTRRASGPVFTCLDLLLRTSRSQNEGLERCGRVSGIVRGLALGFIQIDADAYISQKGEVSASITAFHHLLITNRLILQPRIDVKLQMQSVPDLELGAGITDFELGARLRYEFTRNVAPYVGVNWDRKVGQTATIARNNGEACPTCRSLPACGCSGRTATSCGKVRTDTVSIVRGNLALSLVAYLGFPLVKESGCGRLVAPRTSQKRGLQRNRAHAIASGLSEHWPRSYP